MQNHKNEIGSLIDSGALTGEVHRQRVFHPEEMDVEDFSCGTLTFENGARIQFKVAWAANMPESSDILLVSRKAGLSLPSGKLYFGETGEKQLPMSPCPYDTPFPGHVYLIDNLRKVLQDSEEPVVKPEETIRVSQIIEMFYRSAELNREITAEELDET